MIAPEVAAKVLAEALRSGGDFAEVYVEDRTTLNLGLEDTRLERAIRGADRGAGVRVLGRRCSVTWEGIRLGARVGAAAG